MELPDDLNFIGETTNCQFFCDVFNDLIMQRIKVQNDKENATASKLDTINGTIEYDLKRELHKNC